MDALKIIARRVIQTNYSSFLGNVLVSQFIDSGASDAEIDCGIEHCVILQEKTQPVGFAIAIDNNLHLMMIMPEYQRVGYGTKLLAYMEQQMFERYPIINLQSFKDNAPANTFYRKNGWRETGEQVLDSSKIEVILFEKRVFYGSSHSLFHNLAEQGHLEEQGAHRL